MTALGPPGRVARRFTAAAGTYDALTRVQDQVAREVIDLAPSSCEPRRVLDVGCGTGRLMHMARARWPDAALTGLDIAAGMIRQAAQRLGSDSRCRFALADAATFSAAPPFDLVLSSSALHWLAPFRAGLANVIQLVAPGGYLAAGLMTCGTLAELHAARRAVTPHLPTLGAMPPWEEVLELVQNRPDIRIHRAEERCWTQIYPSATALLKILHDSGVTGGHLSHDERALTRSELSAVQDYYTRTFAASAGGVLASYRVGYILLERT